MTFLQVSLEGTLAGVLASVLLPVYAAATGLIGWPAVPICIVAAFGATFTESFLGATIQGSIPLLTNEVINALMTLVGALFAAGLFTYLPLLLGVPS